MEKEDRPRGLSKEDIRRLIEEQYRQERTEKQKGKRGLILDAMNKLRRGERVNKGNTHRRLDEAIDAIEN